MKLVFFSHGHQLVLLLQAKEDFQELIQNFKFQQLKSGFKRRVNWNKYQSDPKTYVQSRYLNLLVNPSLQGVNRLFVLSFENENDRTSHSNFYLPKVEIKDYNVMADGKIFFDQPINSNLKRMKMLEKLLLFKEMITPLVFC